MAANLYQLARPCLQFVQATLVSWLSHCRAVAVGCLRRSASATKPLDQPLLGSTVVALVAAVSFATEPSTARSLHAGR